MQNFMLPASIHRELDQINRQFFWNKDLQHRPLISWDRICRPKKCGGLGIRKSKEMNEALQMKLIWKILAEPDNVWVRLIKYKYLRSANILEYKKTGNSSSQWAKLTTLIDKFKTGLIWSVENGKTIKFWTDNWISTSSLRSRDDCPQIGNLEETVSDYILGGR